MLVKDTKMSYDDYSCIKEITKNVPISLSTAYQGNEITGISKILDSWKRQYIQQLQGIVVSYRNVTLMSKYAYIKSDYPIILCNVKATFELFIPTVGSIVNGKVNRISHDYIGCLVHNSINVAIDRSRNEYDSASHFIALDQVILFEITHIGFKRKIIRVKGKITQECVNLMKNIGLTAEETDASSYNQSTSLSHDSRGNTDCEEHGNNEEDNENSSQSLLCDNIELFDSNDRKSSSSKKKKKKSKKFKTKESLNEHIKTLGTENGEISPSLVHDNSLTCVKLTPVSHDSPKKKKVKSNSLPTEHSFYRPSELIEEQSESISSNLQFDVSAEGLSESSFDRDANFSKKKKKKEKKLQTEKKIEELSLSSLTDVTLDSSSHSTRKKKSKQVGDNSSDKISNAGVKEEYSTDTSSHFSLSSKKKKHKRSKPDASSSPSLFSDSLLSNVDETEPFKIPKSPPKKKQKLSQDKFSATEVSRNPKDCDLPLQDKDILPNSLNTYISSQKTSVKTEDFDNLFEVLSPYDPSVENQMFNDVSLNNIVDKSDSNKKAKKRKHESPDRDGLPKKKIGKEESIFLKSSGKHKSSKTKKKSKGKSENDSKKNKKNKFKKRVISSKKKLPKLKKKKKEKGEKPKKKKKDKSEKLKKLKKSSKHRKKDVP